MRACLRLESRRTILFQRRPKNSPGEQDMLENETQMSVCEGELTGTPKVGLSYDECGASCDMVAPKASPKYCWAFQYFTFPDKDPLCFHFSELVAITSYDCDFVSSTLVQSSKSGPVHVKSFLEKKHHKKHHHKKHKKGAKVRKASASKNPIHPAAAAAQPIVAAAQPIVAAA